MEHELNNKKRAETIMLLSYLVSGILLVINFGWLWGLLLTLPVGLVAGVVIGSVITMLFGERR